ncbi:MAG: nucleoside deaminase [Flavobacteriaceae bacterium]|jgi:guanine deaminase|nr:nucleoside deaminase [Flavobacteriaceae bacterium]
MSDNHEFFMRRAIELAQSGIDKNAGGPFGAVIVKDGKIIAEAHNEVTSTNDPTAHAEVTAIRRACKELDTFQLDDCTLYTSCEPCPMCLGAIYWARPKQVFFAGDRIDAAAVDFDDQFIYDELEKAIEKREIPFLRILREEAIPVFDNWKNKKDKQEY